MNINNQDILEALKKDELKFFYQPKVSLITGKVIGSEALIRWIKPNGEIIPPSKFIPIAEQSGLITDITRSMLPKLVRDLLVFADVDDSLVTSFNASGKDFEDDTFSKLLVNKINTSQLSPEKVQVELTETAFLKSGSSIKDNLNSILDAGFGLAMDDFGTGYSSIDTLSLLPFTSLKLDQGIIGRMLNSEKNATIVSSSIRLAHELGISVVAEGVETNHQYHHLLEAGCTKIQGFWISQALPIDQFIFFVNEDIRWSGMPVGLIHMAIFDHIQWRKELVSELIKISSLPSDAINRKYIQSPPLDHHKCRLGKWYYHSGQIFKHRQSFQDLEQPHREFHQIGQQLVNLTKEGGNMEILTPLLQKLSEKSMEVLSKLQNLENEGLTEMHLAHHDWLQHPLNLTAKC
jgi:EAL domain-containing protein (putative c-di-GMP-specific phosphodiesterase class I)